MTQVVRCGGNERSLPTGGRRVRAAEVARAERSLTRGLAGWSIASIVVGGVMAVVGHRGRIPALFVFGRHTAGWGVIDGIIAGAGALVARRRGALDDERAAAHARQLRTTLLVNAAADLGYIAVGTRIVNGRADSRQRLRPGDGWAMVLQGAFLFVFDVVHARRFARIIR